MGIRKWRWVAVTAAALLVVVGLEQTGLDIFGGLVRALTGSMLALVVVGFLAGRLLDWTVARRTPRQRRVGD